MTARKAVRKPQRKPALPLAVRQQPGVGRARRKTAAQKRRAAAAREAREQRGVAGTALTYQGARDLAGIRDMPPGLAAARQARAMPRVAAAAPGRDVIVIARTGEQLDAASLASPRKPRARQRREWCSIDLRYSCPRHGKEARK